MAKEGGYIPHRDTDTLVTQNALVTQLFVLTSGDAKRSERLALGQVALASHSGFHGQETQFFQVFAVSSAASET